MKIVDRRYLIIEDLGAVQVICMLCTDSLLTTHLTWGRENKMDFSPKKMDLLHIVGRKQKQGNPAVMMDLPGGSTFTVTSVPVREKVMTRDHKEKWTIMALRWLAIFFDRCITWERHVQERCSINLGVANHLRSLANTKNGPPPHSMRKAAATVVVCTIWRRVLVSGSEETSSYGPPIDMRCGKGSAAQLVYNAALDTSPRLRPSSGGNNPSWMILNITRGGRSE